MNSLFNKGWFWGGVIAFFGYAALANGRFQEFVVFAFAFLFAMFVDFMRTSKNDL
jgi:hypothetical protein